MEYNAAAGGWGPSAAASKPQMSSPATTEDLNSVAGVFLAFACLSAIGCGIMALLFASSGMAPLGINVVIIGTISALIWFVLYRLVKIFERMARDLQRIASSVEFTANEYRKQLGLPEEKSEPPPEKTKSPSRTVLTADSPGF
jgi:hypothetical protein